MGLQKRLVGRRQRARIGETARMLVDGPSGDHDLVLKGRLVTQAPDIDAVGLSDGLRPFQLARRGISPRSRSSGRATTTWLRGPIQG